MISRIIFSVIMAFVAPCLFAQETDFGSKYGLKKFPLWPYVSLGKAF